MSAQVVCPHCKTRMSLPADAAGKSVKCPKCKQTFAAKAAPAQTPARPNAPAPKPATQRAPRAPQARRGWSLPAMIGGVVVGIVALTGGAFLAFGGRPHDEVAQVRKGPVPAPAEKIATPPPSAPAVENKVEPASHVTVAAALEEKVQVAQATPAKKKKKGAPKTPPPTPTPTTKSPEKAPPPYASLAPSFDEVPLLRLDGQTPLPAFLVGDGPIVTDGEGLKDSVVRSVVSDLDRRDFVADVQFRFAPNERSILHIGLGGTKMGGLGWDDSVSSRVHGPGHGGYGTLFFHGQAEKPLAKFKTPGPHIFRIEKKGDALTLAIGTIDQGRFAPYSFTTIAPLAEKAPFLKRPNAALLIHAGGGWIEAVRFLVDGKPADAGPMVAAASPPTYEAAPLVKLGEKSSTPLYLDASPDLKASADGIQRGTLRTVEGNLISKDFLADFQFRFAPSEQSILHIGLGGLGSEGSVSSRIHGPGFGGYGTLTISGRDEKPLGTFRTAGPHVFRLEKTGDRLSMAIGPIEEGKFAPFFRKTILNLKAAAPFLSKENSSIFAQPNGATLEAVRFLVNGKAPEVRVAKVAPPAPVKVDTKTPMTTAKVDPKVTPKKVEPEPATKKESTLVTVLGAEGRENLIVLGKGKLPSYLQPQGGLVPVPDGGVSMGNRIVRTAATDFNKKDFTFDVVFRFKPGESVILVAGIGPGQIDHNGANINNTVCSRLHGPGFGGYGTFHVSRRPEEPLGNYKTSGQHVFRLQKRGNVLTMAIADGYKDKFVADHEKALPDLAGTASYLNEQNSWLFFGASGVVDAVRLVVDGEPIESRDLALKLPARIVEGKPLAQAVTGDAGGRTFGLTNGPKGAQVSATGQLTWTPAADQLGHHLLRIKATSAKQSIALVHELDVVSKEDAQLVGGDLSKVDRLHRLPLTTDKTQLTPGLDGASLLLLDGDKLHRLVGNGMTVKETFTLPAPCEKIGERADTFVALSDAKKALLILDKKTMAVRRSIAMDYFRRNDLVLNPTRPLAYVAISVVRGEFNHNLFMIVDESNGEVHEPEGLTGLWLTISADGKFLYTGNKTYIGGTSFGELAVYEIRQTVRPYLQRVKDEPGGNGSAIALSADGKRVSYLSFTGYPLFSKSIPAWDPKDLEKRPVTYPTKEFGASCQWVAFHPKLELAAAPIENGGAICYRRETGEPLPSYVDATYPPLGDVRTRRCFFAPDGRHLLLECEGDGERFLRRVALRLSPAEMAALGK